MATKRSYKKKDLDKYVEENEIELIGEYDHVHVHTTIKGKCKTEGCEGVFCKKFTSIINGGGPYCIKCCNINKDKKTKETCLQKYGVNNPGNSKEAKEKSKKTCLRRYGVEHTTQSKNMKEKSKATCLERYGVENPAQSVEVKKKSKETCKERYGLEYYLQTNDKKEKSKSTCLERYGVENPAQSEEAKEKSKETCLEKYGVEYTLQSEDVRFKGKQTILEKYGSESISASKWMRDKLAKKVSDKYNKILNEMILNGLELSNNYNNQIINRNTIINGKCNNDICDKSFEKNIRQIIEISGPYCEMCTKKHKAVKMNKTKLEKYGCETCKINLVYDLFTNLDCERICSDCSNPKRNPKYQKTKEWLVVRKLREDIPDIPFIHNKSVGNECTLQDREDTNGHLYPDIRFKLFGFDLIVEVDEHKHRGAGYSCDERRMYDIVAELGLPCVFIRYNPDDKKSDYNVLLEMIKEYLEKDIDEIDFNEDINGHKNDGLKIEYLFY